MSHGKGHSDGLGGVIKSLAFTAVCAKKLIIRDGKELYDILIDRYTLHNNVSMLQEKHCVMDHQFFFIKKEEMDSFRNNLENNPFKTYRGTRKLRQITCHKSIKNHQLLVWKYACLCDPCNTLSMGKCESYNTLGTFCKRITVNLALKNNQSNIDNKNEEEVDDEWEWEVSEAVQMVQPNDTVVIRSDDTFNPYYLIKSLTEPSEITDEFCDD